MQKPYQNYKPSRKKPEKSKLNYIIYSSNYMKIYDYLIKDHQKVSFLFKKMLSLKTNYARKKIQEKIIKELLIHAVTEQNTFYKKLMQYNDSKKCAQHGKKEHKEITDNIKKLIKEDVGSAEWLKAIKKLKKNVEHHVSEEEGAMFALAKKILTDEQAKKITQQMKKQKISAKKKLSISFIRIKPI